MTTVEAQRVAATIDDLMYEHRVAWAAALVGEDALDLGAVEDPAGALDAAPAAVWLNGYTASARESVVAAAERGARLVIAVPAGSDDGEDLARALPAATIVPQAAAGGSLIGAGAQATVQVSEPAARESASWLLVCANVEPGEAAAQLATAVGAQLATQLARLEEALESLREANVRLAREKLGRHDAAAGGAISRAEREANYLRERFEFEQQLAIRHHDWFKAAEARLDQPQYRLADKIYGALRRIPGIRSLVKLLRR